MKDITIPREALEAAARVFYGPGGLSGGIRDVHRNTVRAACLAMLEAWPGMQVVETRVGQEPWSGRIYIPLPQETRDE